MTEVFGFVQAIGVLKTSGQLLLSTDELLPVTFFNAAGQETSDLNEAVRGSVIYMDCHQFFSLDEVGIITVH